MNGALADIAGGDGETAVGGTGSDNVGNLTSGGSGGTAADSGASGGSAGKPASKFCRLGGVYNSGLGGTECFMAAASSEVSNLDDPSPGRIGDN